jgi:hypothetical protein
MPDSDKLTRTDRNALLSVVKQRTAVAVAQVDEHCAVLRADFEKKLAAIYKPEDHAVWKEAHERAERLEAEIGQAMQKTFAELGIPPAWAPSISFSWYGRGENYAASRRAELRLVAKTEIDRRAKTAKTELHRRSAEAQERILVAGLTSETAHALLEGLPSVAELLPPLELEAVERIKPSKPRGVLQYHDDC